jgi:NAD(P)H-hydrate epimerase
MRAADLAATELVGLSLLQMMENAGRELAELTRLTLGGSVAGRDVVVLAGIGGNAGGGLVAGRRLAGWGADVCVVFAHPILRLKPGACAQLEPLLAAGVRAAVAGHDRPYTEIAAEIVRADAVLDALIGYSLDGRPDEAHGTLISMAGLGDGPLISLDLPSGIDATTGERPGAAVTADATLAVALPKSGTRIGEGRRCSGVTYLADIGLPLSVFEELGIRPGFPYASGSLTRVG